MKLKGFSNEFLSINHILKEWNPINVDEPFLSDEYIGFIPAIIKVRHNMIELVDYLENMIVNELGTAYNSLNEQHKKDLLLIAKKINEISML